MLTKSEKTLLRQQLFMHLDGLALASTFNIFRAAKFTDFILANNDFTLNDIANIKGGNHGYINIGLRLLTSQGILLKHQNKYNITNRGLFYFKSLDAFEVISNNSTYLINIDNILFNEGSYTQIIKSINFLINNKLSVSNNPIEKNIYLNLSGIIIGPLLCALGMSNSYQLLCESKSIKPLFEIIKSNKIQKSIQNLFCKFNWLDNDLNFTETGYFFISRASAYGVTTSYLPMFNSLNELYFGNPENVLDKKINNNETHVNRKMNVWGSGGAHSLYFKKIDLIISKVFNKPITEQPQGIADMGCGDGTFLIHLYKLILNNTLRGSVIDKYPLIIIGADFNQEALDVTKKNLSINDIKSILIKADISNPKIFAKNLQDNHNLNLSNMINVRSFLDHNRIFETPKELIENNSIIGSFSKRGTLLKPSEVLQNLIEHFNKWKPYCKKHGLLLLELHTIKSSLVKLNIGNTLASAYDATHGYSDQYILSLDDFLYAADKSNLKIDKNSAYRFPNSIIPTVSINFLINKSS